MRTFLSIAIASLFALSAFGIETRIQITPSSTSNYGVPVVVQTYPTAGNPLPSTATYCLWGGLGTNIWITSFTLHNSSAGVCDIPNAGQYDTQNLEQAQDLDSLQVELINGYNPPGVSPGSYTVLTETTSWSYIPPPPGGSGDPHFVGFNGEKMEVKRDENAANQLFHLYCSPSITITTLFYEYPDKLLFMTKFWVRLGETMFTLNLSTKPKMLSANFDGPFYVEETGRNRIEFEGGHMEWDDVMLRVVYGYLKINFSTKVYLNNSPYMNIEFGRVKNQQVETEVTGILGRTLHHKMTDAEFEDYLPYKASLSDVIDFSCKSISNNQLQVEN